MVTTVRVVPTVGLCVVHEPTVSWTLDVLNVVRRLGKAEFTLAEVYARESLLARLHPDNLHVRDKIRQQLQRLRDLGLLEFLARGQYRLV